ncbi:MAG: hypothetical protein AB2L18_09850 [Anaerolineaceae bacterium]
MHSYPAAHRDAESNFDHGYHEEFEIGTSSMDYQQGILMISMQM